MSRYFNRTVMLVLAGFFLIVPLISRPLLASGHWGRSHWFRGGGHFDSTDGSDPSAPAADPLSNLDPCTATDTAIAP
jgi:hypothetical protein